MSVVENRIERYKLLDFIPSNLTGNIITPYPAACGLLDILPLEVWTNPNLKFIDISCKSGIFLVEAYNRLMIGLTGEIPDAATRANHILENQLYGIAMDGLSAALSRRMLYNNFRNDGNILELERYIGRVKSGNSELIDAIQKGFGGEVKFDVVIGNPPYQEMTEGGSIVSVAVPIYHTFMNSALGLNSRYISMIIPSRWASGGKSVLDTFRGTMVNGRGIKSIYNYERASDVFSGVDIAGGVQYFLYDREYNGEIEVHNCSTGKEDVVDKRSLSKYTYEDKKTKKCNYMVILDNQSAKIADNVLKVGGARMHDCVLQYKPFGLSSDFEDSVGETATKNIRVVCSNSRDTWTSISEITQNKHVIGKWKVCAAKVTCEHGGTVTKNGNMNVLSRPFIIKPNEVCSMTYLVLGTFDSQVEAENCITYIKTKLARFLMSVTLSGMNMTSRNYMFVPIQDYSKAWTDKELYNKYGLENNEIEYIESKIKTME